MRWEESNCGLGHGARKDVATSGDEGTWYLRGRWKPVLLASRSSFLQSQLKFKSIHWLSVFTKSCLRDLFRHKISFNICFSNYLIDSTLTKPHINLLPTKPAVVGEYLLLNLSSSETVLWVHVFALVAPDTWLSLGIGIVADTVAPGWRRVSVLGLAFSNSCFCH